MSTITKLGLVPLLLSSSSGCGTAPARDVQITSTFTVAPGQERYACYRMNVDQDVFVSKIATHAAPGVHHQILALTDQTEPEGLTECGALGLSVSNSWIFVASSDPEELVMPTGIAYRIPAGTQLVLQMHLVNPRDTPLDSASTIDLSGIAEDHVTTIAQLVAAGSVQIDLPPGQATTVNGKCTLSTDVSLFGLLPHMHYKGKTFKAWVANGAGNTMIYNDAFLGEAQRFGSFAPLTMPRGASLNVECNYFNDTTARIVYGASALDEMCFAFTYFYPAIDGHGPLCVN
jgi:hypothetical protein